MVLFGLGSSYFGINFEIFEQKDSENICEGPKYLEIIPFIGFWKKYDFQLELVTSWYSRNYLEFFFTEVDQRFYTIKSVETFFRSVLKVMRPGLGTIKKTLRDIAPR